MSDTTYRLEEQVGYLLRLVHQRHAAIFQSHISADLTPPQFSALMRVAEHGALSQNRLGRLIALDTATIKGVVDRLRAKGLLAARPDPEDRRKSLISLTEAGRRLIGPLEQDGHAITAATLAPLSEVERMQLRDLLGKLV